VSSVFGKLALMPKGRRETGTTQMAKGDMWDSVNMSQEITDWDLLTANGKQVSSLNDLPYTHRQSNQS